MLWLGYLDFLQNRITDETNGKVTEDPTAENKACPGDRCALAMEAGSRADAYFSKAVRYDNEYGSSWTQWGILTYQRYQLTNTLPDRIALLGKAIEKLKRASTFASKDPLPVRRLNDALWEMANLREDIDRLARDENLSDYQKYDLIYEVESATSSGRTTFCSVVHLRSWPDKRERDDLENSYRTWCA